MPWAKSPSEVTSALESLAPEGDDVTRRKMFGYPSVFVGGHLLMGTFESKLVLRLPPGTRQGLLDSGEAEPFAPMAGRPLKEYVALDLSAGPERLQELVEAGLGLVRSLPPKETKR